MHSHALPSSLSAHLNPSAPCFCPSLGLQESSTVKSFNSDTGSGEHTRITMKTRVAVRDRNPHRFQVVPLRDIAAKVSLPDPVPSNRLPTTCTPTGSVACSPPNPVSSYSHPKSMYPSLFRSGNTAKENRVLEGSWTGSNSTKRVQPLHKMESSGCSYPPFPLPALDLDKKIVALAELDFNRTDPRSSPTNRKSDFSLLLETTQADSHVLRNSSVVSSIKPKGNKHTISQSLHVKSLHDTRRLKFNSLTDIPNTVAGPAILFHITEPSGNSVNISGRVQPKTKYLSSTLEDRPPKSKKRWSKKRHAMYTPSLLMPYIQGLAISEENVPSDNREISQTKGSPETHDLTAVDQDTTIRQEFQESISCLDDQDPPRRVIHDPFEILPSGSMDFLPIDSPLHHSSPKAMAGALSPNLTFSEHEALCVIQSKNSVGSQLTEIAYPEIILDLFVQIDKAIAAWSAKAM